MIRIFTRNIVAAALIVLLHQPVTSNDRFVPSGKPLYLERVEFPDDISFAREQLTRHLGMDQPAEWEEALHAGAIKIGRADLNDDGINEVFIVVETSLWCGSIGCSGVLLQKDNDNWRLMEKPDFPGERVIIMTEKRFGYHKVFTGNAIYTFRDGKTYEILDASTRHLTR